MRMFALGATFALVLVGAYLLGTRSGGPSVGSAEPASTPPPTVASEDAPVPADGTPARMDGHGFWQLVASTRAQADGDTGRQSAHLEHELRALPPEQIVAFQRHRQQLDRRAYTWDLRGAAYVIEDGCSEDCFRDFRAY